MGAEELPALALSQPQQALVAARRHLAGDEDPRTRSFAHQAAGIVLRDSGETTQALAELRLAVRESRRSRDAERVADVRASLGVALAMAGRSRAGLAELDAAATGSRGPTRARVLLRRAYVLTGLGRYADALQDMRRAIAGARAAGDTVWEARALNNRAGIHLLEGTSRHAERDAQLAETLFREAGQEMEAASALHNRGAAAYVGGDLPRCLGLFDDAAQGYARQEVSWPELALDRCQAFLAAGLTSEAVGVVRAGLEQAPLPPVRHAELLYAAATAALADGDAGDALVRARAARAWFRRQGRDWWEARADLVALQARQARGDGGEQLTRLAGELAERLVLLGAEDAPLALLLAGKLAAPKQRGEAHRLFEAAARYRRRSAPLVRATGWLGQALDRSLDDDPRGVFSACGRGLDALDEHRQTLGSSELRALASRHGRDLATLALREAVRAGGARRLLTWSERWRATALTEPPVRPPEHGAGQQALLRSQARRLAEAREAGDQQAAERARHEWERTVRHQRHLLAGGRSSSARLDVPSLVEDVGDATLLELVEVDGTLHLVTVRSGRVRARTVGPVDAALQAVAAARFVLRQSARGRPTSVAGVGDRLEAALLGGAVPGDGPVVIAPPSRLHSAPWGLMPVLAGRPISVVPSALMWQLARSRTPPADGGTVLVAGPGLGTGGAEVDVLARTAGSLLLRDGDATVERTLAALDGARLAHVAAHGDFRPDSPMFSSLVLDDGPLTVHDLELLGRAPHRLVLSACDSGVMVPVGADELLGLTAALLSLGTAGVLASVAEVNDEATVPFMLQVHERLAAGDDLASALLAARTAADDPLAEATAASFVALGV